MKLANFRNVAYLAMICVTPVILALGFVADHDGMLRASPPAANPSPAAGAPGR